QQPRVRLAKDRERSGLARDVQTSAAGVKREHVRPFSYREPRRDLAPGEVQQQKLARLLTRDEREMPRQVEVETVVALDAERDSVFHFELDRIDHHQVAVRLIVGVDEVAFGIGLGIAGLATDWNLLQDFER